MDIEEQVVCDECRIDEMMLESFGVELTDELRNRINESLARNDSEKLFGVDGFLVFNASDAASYIEENDVFADYVENEFYPQVDSCSALMLIEQWSDTFIKERLVAALNSLDKGEVFRFDDFFRNIVDMDEEVNIPLEIDGSSASFAKMPRIVRIF